jgi:hypothetical protein
LFEDVTIGPQTLSRPEGNKASRVSETRCNSFA